MRATRKERERFISDMTNHTFDHGTSGVAALRAARRLLRYGATYGRIQELWCSDERVCNTERLRQYYERKEARIEQRVTELCASIGCGVVFQGDPRGNTIKIVLPDGYTGSDWGKEGLPVPTA